MLTPSEEQQSIKESSNNPTSHDTKIFITVISLVTFTFVAILVIGYFLFTRTSPQEVAAVEEQIQDLYLNQEEVFLSEEIDQTAIDRASDSVKKVDFLQRQDLVTKVNDIQSKYNDLLTLNQYFEAEEALLGGAMVYDITSMTLSNSVTRDNVQEHIHELKQDESDFSVALLNVYQQMDEQFERADLVASQIEQLELDEFKTWQDLPTGVNYIIEIEEHYGELLQQPAFADIDNEFKVFVTHIAQLIYTGEEYGYYDENLWYQIQSSPYLTQAYHNLLPQEELYISLTFDDGPNTEFTPQILDILEQNDVKATFFVMGAYVDENPEVARQIVDEGHVIANHTYNHFDLATLPEEEILTQFRWTQQSIEEATGVVPDLYRLPFGSGGYPVVELLDQYGMTSILWSLDSMDWAAASAWEIYDTVMNQLHSNTLLLMHDTNQNTVDALAMLVPELKEMGYEFVHPGEVGFNQRYFE